MRDRLVVVTRPNPTAPRNQMTRVVDIEGDGRVLEGEIPLREVDPDSREFEIVDPVGLGINLTALMHRAAAAEHERT